MNAAFSSNSHQSRGRRSFDNACGRRLMPRAGATDAGPAGLRSARVALVRTFALALCLATVISPALAADTDLLGGVFARFDDKPEQRRDKMRVHFRAEAGVFAPLPDPTRRATTITVRAATATGVRTIGPTPLSAARWQERIPGEFYLYRDRTAAAAGIQTVHWYTASDGGGLWVKARGEAYGMAPVSGPADWVEVELALGAAVYCGRFEPGVSATRRNDSERVHFIGPSAPCGSTVSTSTTTSSTTTTTLTQPGEIRVPAEWEQQEAVWLQWPGRYEKAYEPAFAEMSTIIAAYQPLHILYDSDRIAGEARDAIAAAGGDPDDPAIFWHAIANDNAWMRDNGPVYVARDGQLRIQDWGFDAWGGAFGSQVPYAADDAVPPQIAALTGMPVDTVDVVHERGNLEFNGVDAVILNWSVIGDPARNPGYTRAQAEADMRRWFGVTRVVLIEGWVPSDFTRGHVDGIARFIDPDTVVVGQCTAASVCQPGDAEARVYDDAADAISAAGFTVVREPFEGRARYNGGPEFSTDYMNWLVGNGFVIAVGFENPTTNNAARARLQGYYPGRDVYIVDMLPSWDAGGGAHCHTNDQPAAITASGYTPWTP